MGRKEKRREPLHCSGRRTQCLGPLPARAASLGDTKGPALGGCEASAHPRNLVRLS